MTEVSCVDDDNDVFCKLLVETLLNDDKNPLPFSSSELFDSQTSKLTSLGCLVLSFVSVSFGFCLLDLLRKVGDNL
jgi:hypothetical protein